MVLEFRWSAEYASLIKTVDQECSACGNAGCNKDAAAVDCCPPIAVPSDYKESEGPAAFFKTHPISKYLGAGCTDKLVSCAGAWTCAPSVPTGGCAASVPKGNICAAPGVNGGKCATPDSDSIAWVLIGIIFGAAAALLGAVVLQKRQGQGSSSVEGALRLLPGLVLDGVALTRHKLSGLSRGGGDYEAVGESAAEGNVVSSAEGSVAPQAAEEPGSGTNSE